MKMDNKSSNYQGMKKSFRSYSVHLSQQETPEKQMNKNMQRK